MDGKNDTTSARLDVSPFATMMSETFWGMVIFPTHEPNLVQNTNTTLLTRRNGQIHIN